MSKHTCGRNGEYWSLNSTQHCVACFDLAIRAGWSEKQLKKRHAHINQSILQIQRQISERKTMPSIMETRRASFQKKEDAEIEIALADRVENWAKKMLDKLIENKAKGYPEGWEKNPTEQLIERVEEEFIELKTAIKKRQSHKTITAEAADVANMAMMVSDAYKYRNT